MLFRAVRGSMFRFKCKTNIMLKKIWLKVLIEFSMHYNYQIHPLGEGVRSTAHNTSGSPACYVQLRIFTREVAKSLKLTVYRLACKCHSVVHVHVRNCFTISVFSIADTGTVFNCQYRGIGFSAALLCDVIFLLSLKYDIKLLHADKASMLIHTKTF